MTDDGIPTPAPTPHVQYSNAARLLFLGAETVSASSARDPIFVMQTAPPAKATLGDFILSPITTTDENLGPNKGKVTQSAKVVNNSEACRKSEKILSKLWADDLDTDQAFDNTLEPDTYTEQQQALLAAHLEVHKFLSQPTDTVKKGKRGRPRKPKSPKAFSGTKSKHKTATDPIESGSDAVNTRSKHGVIKSNPKYGD
ncbi:hypothetical protein MtrunA17_Chr4g0045501 [Medicago truncatula]|uniref:Uncharacterized protein n=1 Tax=Medicago truncatula TaxID=3880 RepID=A0A396IBV0_MEDTR|nr:hypothetical protein MtrunA17_Chr4g0045501 [Medicago truncatula]